MELSYDIFDTIEIRKIKYDGLKHQNKTHSVDKYRFNKKKNIRTVKENKRNRLDKFYVNYDETTNETFYNKYYYDYYLDGRYNNYYNTYNDNNIYCFMKTMQENNEKNCCCYYPQIKECKKSVCEIQQTIDWKIKIITMDIDYINLNNDNIPLPLEIIFEIFNYTNICDTINLLSTCKKIYYYKKDIDWKHVVMNSNKTYIDNNYFKILLCDQFLYDILKNYECWDMVYIRNCRNIKFEYHQFSKLDNYHNLQLQCNFINAMIEENHELIKTYLNKIDQLVFNLYVVQNFLITKYDAYIHRKRLNEIVNKLVDHQYCIDNEYLITFDTLILTHIISTLFSKNFFNLINLLNISRTTLYTQSFLMIGIKSKYGENMIIYDADIYKMNKYGCHKDYYVCAHYYYNYLKDYRFSVIYNYWRTLSKRYIYL